MIRYTCTQKNLEQEKYALLSKTLERIAGENKIQIDEIFHSSNEEIIPIIEMEDRNQKVVIFDDYVYEKNQNYKNKIFYARET